MKRFLLTAPTVVALALLVAGLWLLFASPQLGGATRYAVVEGASMEPGLSEGDLVLVRGGGEPDVGDVVLYRDPALDVRVLHRVVAREDGRLVLRGDANGFRDDARPRESEVIGTYWFSVPRVGAALLWLGAPLPAALLAFALTVIALSGAGPARVSTEEAASG